MSDLDLDKTIQDGADFAFDYASAIFFSFFQNGASRNGTGRRPLSGCLHLLDVSSLVHLNFSGHGIHLLHLGPVHGKDRKSIN